MTAPDWWVKPRHISVLVDNDSWILPHASHFVEECRAGGDEARLCRTHDEVMCDGITFLLGCVRLVPDEALARNHRNLVVHESDLPQGRGFSPLTWAILEGRNEIPICLLDAADNVDAGDVVYRDVLIFQGHELVDELRRIQGDKTVELCRRFLSELIPPRGTPQSGEATFYPRRRPENSQLDPHRSIVEQLNLLRVVDNDRYPAFFEIGGVRYLLRIEKSQP